MPLLQYLMLKAALPPVSQPPSRTVSLPRLLFLSISHELEASSVALFRHVLFPASTRLHLTYAHRWFWRDIIGAVSNRPILNTIPTPLLAPFHTADISATAIVCYRHGSPLFPDVKHGGFRFSPASPQFTLEFTSINSDLAIAKAFLSNFPLSELRYLRLRLSEWYDEGSVETWLDLFGAMTAIRELSVQLWGAETLPEALGYPEPKLFPHLERLHVDGCEPPEYATSSLPGCYEQYRSAFEARKVQGCPLKEVLFRNCRGMTQSHVDAFAEVVEKVQSNRRTSF